MKEARYFDSHTHVQLSDFDAERDEVIARAQDAGVWILNVGVDEESSKKAIELAHEYKEGVYAAVGLHPNDVREDFDFDTLARLAEDKKVIAIGETGLDYFRTEDIKKRELQKKTFLQHLELSKKVNKPIIIHCRNAHNDLVSILNSYFLIHNSLRGVMHFFGGEGPARIATQSVAGGAWEKADEYLKMGFYLSFSGVVTFANYAHAENIRKIPLERILIETDAPFATPVPYRGTRNEPSYVIETAKKIAEIKGVSLEELAMQTTRNAKKLFKLS